MTPRIFIPSSSLMTRRGCGNQSHEISQKSRGDWVNPDYSGAQQLLVIFRTLFFKYSEANGFTTFHFTFHCVKFRFAGLLVIQTFAELPQSLGPLTECTVRHVETFNILRRRALLDPPMPLLQSCKNHGVKDSVSTSSTSEVYKGKT